MNIFVANLSFRVNNDDLKRIFDEYGEVTSAKVIMDKETGRSRGFGFVEMSQNEQGKAAIEELNGAELDGKVMSVSEARPRPEGGNGGNGGRRPSGGGNRNFGGEKRRFNNNGGGNNRY
jgi:RNA recognition motif-containing protein